MLPENFHGIMIGNGEKSDFIDKKIDELKLTRRILRIKGIPNREIHKYYKMADYFVNFNDHEIFGMSILEAMYQGCNVIAFHAPGPNTIIDENSGFLTNSLEDMLRIINARLKKEEGKPRDRIVKNFTWDVSAKIIDNWIREEEYE